MRRNMQLAWLGGALALGLLIARAEALPAAGGLSANIAAESVSVEQAGWRRGGYDYDPNRYYYSYNPYRNSYNPYRSYRYNYSYYPYHSYRYHYCPRRYGYSDY